MKKILYLVTEDWYFWSHRINLAEAVREKGYEVHVLTRHGKYAGAIKEKHCSLYPLSMDRSIGSPLREISTLFRIYRYYRDIRPDLVHQIALKPIVAGSIAAWFARVPVVVNSYTGLGFLFISNSMLSRLVRRVLIPVLSLLFKDRRYYSIVQNSKDEELLANLGLIMTGSTSLIRGSGIDTKEFSYSRETTTDCPVVLFASRLLKDKGVLEFIGAARKLKSDGVIAKFVMVGDVDAGNPTSISRADAAKWVEEGLVEWWGYREDMAEVFRQAHIVCLPSYREGLPKVLLEAAAVGRAIVTTEAPGCSEVVIDGVNGLLVPVRDTAKLATAIRTLLDSPGLRVAMGTAGRKLVEENFSMDMINTATINLYNQLIKN